MRVLPVWHNFVSAEFFLKNDPLLNTSWFHEISFYVSRGADSFWLQTLEVLLEYEVNTSQLILPDFGENLVSW